MKKQVVWSLVLVLLLAFCSSGYAEAAEIPPMPQNITLATYEVGGSGYIHATALGEGIFKTFNVRVRSQPLATAVSRTLSVRVGRTHAALTSDSLYAQEGLYDYGASDWGPQAVRNVMVVARQSAYAFAAAGDSGIKTIADVKGKRVAWVSGSPFTQNAIEGMLAFGGLTLEDVELIEVFSLASAYQGVIDGKVDVAPYDSTGSTTYELEALKGINWIEFPIEDEEGWARLTAKNPLIKPIHCAVGAGLSEENRIWLPTVPFPEYLTYADADEDEIYWLTKMMVESYENYKGIHTQMEWYEVEDCLALEMLVPYHEGSVRYYKEIGLWTEQMEKNQQELIQRQADLAALWEKTVDDSFNEGITAGDFSAYWAQKRAEAFPTFWSSTPVE